MSTLQVTIKLAGKTYPVSVDVNGGPVLFKTSIYQSTGVPIDRMKVMVKGGILKDDSDLSKLALKEGQSITVIGTAGPLPTVPVKQAVFLEDMDPDEVARAGGDPPGLINLGQTCYLNSSLQVLRTMPQLSSALESFSAPQPSLEGRFTASIKNLFSGMSQTTDAIPPFLLLNSLRTLAPQFQERDRTGGFAQQDADEAWTQIISALRASLMYGDQGSFVDRFMSVEMTRILSCAESEDEPKTTSREHVLKLECNISISTNFLMSGILDSLDQQIEKNSPSLGRTAIYNQKSRLSRLPTYLAIHMVRFYWRRDIQKKAKIMRKVKYPLQLDVLDLVTDELRAKIMPVNTETKQILKARDDRAKAIQNAKGLEPDSKPEPDIRLEEAKAIQNMAGEQGVLETGTNPSAVYELCAMVTHKGPSADSGHYIGWTRKEDSIAPSGEEEWFKFDDHKVSTVKAEKVLAMDGGGEDSVGYILLYRSALG